jgi:hypothetical protein
VQSVLVAHCAPASAAPPPVEVPPVEVPPVEVPPVEVPPVDVLASAAPPPVPEFEPPLVLPVSSESPQPAAMMKPASKAAASLYAFMSRSLLDEKQRDGKNPPLHQPRKHYHTRARGLALAIEFFQASHP